MQNAVVVGTDLNTWCIRKAQKTITTNSARSCIETLQTSALGNLDVTFCLAVFQRTENRLESNNGPASGFSFDRFERELRMLDRKLRPGGLLFIDHADFRFTDTSIAGKYTPLTCEANQRTRKRRLFGRDNALIAEEYVADRIFVKTSEPANGRKP